MKINRITTILLSVGLFFLPAIAIGKDKTLIQWDDNSQAVYDLLVAELQNADANYESSADTLVKFAKKQKDDRLFTKAFRSLLQTERYDDAVDLMKAWKKNTKLSVDELYVLALALDKQTDKALSVIKENTTDTDTGEPDDNKLVGYIQILMENWYHPESLTVIKELYKIYPDSNAVGRAYTQLATLYGEIDQAIEVIDKRLFKTPTNITFLQVKSDIYRYDLQLKKAEKVWTDSLNDYPKNDDIRLAYAQFLYNKYDFQAASKQLKQISANDNFVQQVLSMKVAVQLGKYQDGNKAFQWNTLETTDTDKAHYYYGDVLLEKKQYDLALKQFEQVDKNSDFYLSAALKIGQIYYAQSDNTDKADKWFAELQNKYHFDNADLVREKANALDKADKKKQGYRLLTEYLNKNPKDEDIRYMRSLFAAELFMQDKAIADLKRLHTTSPDNLDFQNALGYTLLTSDKRDTDDLDEATTLIKKSLFQNPMSPATADSMGWSKYLYKKYSDALPYFRFAYRKYLDGEVIGHYIMVLMANDQEKLAKKLYRLEMQYEPNRKKIKQITQSIKQELSE